jgi:hypothetical protein
MSPCLFRKNREYRYRALQLSGFFFLKMVFTDKLKNMQR